MTSPLLPCSHMVHMWLGARKCRKRNVGSTHQATRLHPAGPAYPRGGGRSGVSCRVCTAVVHQTKPHGAILGQGSNGTSSAFSQYKHKGLGRDAGNVKSDGVPGRKA